MVDLSWGLLRGLQGAGRSVVRRREDGRFAFCGFSFSIQAVVFTFTVRDIALDGAGAVTRVSKRPRLRRARGSSGGLSHRDRDSRLEALGRGPESFGDGG